MRLQIIYGENGVMFAKMVPRARDLEKLKAFRVDSKISVLITNYQKYSDKRLRMILKENYPKIGYIKIDEKASDAPRVPLMVYVIYTMESSFNLKDFTLNLGRENNENYILYAQKDGRYDAIECYTNRILQTCDFNLFDEKGMLNERVFNEAINSLCKANLTFNHADEVSLQNVYRDKLCV